MLINVSFSFLLLSSFLLEHYCLPSQPRIQRKTVPMLINLNFSVHIIVFFCLNFSSHGVGHNKYGHVGFSFGTCGRFS